MSMPTVSIGLSIDATDVSTSPGASLGEVFVIPGSSGLITNGSGDQAYIYVQNSSGVSIPVGTVVGHTLAEAPYKVAALAAATHPMRAVGVAHVAIPAGSYGFVLRSGVGSVLCTAAVAAGQALRVDAVTAGQVVGVAAVTDAALGVSTVALGAPGLVSARINCLG